MKSMQTERPSSAFTLRWLLALVLGLACGGSGDDNRSPDDPAVTIAPEGTTTTEVDLVATATAEDPDGDGVTFHYRWFRNGDATDHRSDAVPASETNKGEVWWVSVRADDGEDRSRRAVDSAPIRIINSPPVVAAHHIEPSTPTVESELTAVGDTSDADGDSLLLIYQWVLETPRTLVGTSETLDLTSLEKGNRVFLDLAVSDGEVSRSVQTPAVQIENALPSAPAVELRPRFPFAQSEALNCLMTGISSDADGDPITYSVAWTVDDHPYAGPVATTSLPGDTIAPEDTERGETWTCAITPNDSEEDGPAGSVSATLPNSLEPQLAVTERNICTIDTEGALECTGDNATGMLDVPGGRYRQLSIDLDYGCAIRDDDGEAHCWGSPTEPAGQLDPPGGSFLAITVHATKACGIRIDKSIDCWGNDAPTSAPDGAFESLSGECGVLDSGEVRCFGARAIAFADDITQGAFRKISIDTRYGCGIRPSGDVECFASAFHGESLFGEMAPPGGPFVEIDTSYRHGCGIRSDATIRCWGDSSGGQLGAPDGAFLHVATAGRFGCAVSVDGTLQCWGTHDANR